LELIQALLQTLLFNFVLMVFLTVDLPNTLARQCHLVLEHCCIRLCLPVSLFAIVSVQSAMVTLVEMAVSGY